MKKHVFSRLLSMLLVLSLIASFAVPVQATGLSWEKVDRAVSADLDDRLVQNETEEPTHRDTDIVRVSIVLEEKPTIQAGYSTMAIAQNHKAMAYQERLQARQQVVAQNISSGLDRPRCGPSDFNSISAGCIVTKIPTNNTATSLIAPHVKWFLLRMLLSVVLKDKNAARRIKTISISAGKVSVTSPKIWIPITSPAAF